MSRGQHIPSKFARPCRLAAAIGLPFMLAACALLPPTQPPALPKPISDYAVSQSLTAPEASWPPEQWWKTYDDVQLSTLIDEALANAPSLKEAEARIGAANAFEDSAAAALFPKVNAEASVQETKLPYHSVFPTAAVPKGWNTYGIGDLSLSWEIDFWGKNRAALAAAASETQAAQAEAAEARLVLSTSTASTYAELARLFDDQAAAIDALRVRSETADLFQRRFAEALENEGSAARAASAKSSAESELVAINESIDLTRHRLAALVGAGPDRGLAIVPPKTTLAKTFGLPASLPAELIGRRPDIVAARLRAEAGDQHIKEAKAAFYPNVNLIALVGVQALGLNMLTKGGSDIGSVAPAVTLPILDGGRLRANYRKAESEHDLAVAQYDDAVAHALEDVADAATSSRALALRLTATQAAADEAATAYRVANDRYRGGLANYLEVLTAEDSLIASRRALAELQSRAFALDIALVRALGGGFRSDSRG
jgi:NodT family efflux transporter outer membrane factor (OMF) lipoprotein